jgi:hypothetical protein
MCKAIIIMEVLRTKSFCRDSNFEWLRPCCRRKNCQIGISLIKTGTTVNLWSLRTNALPPLLCRGYIHKLTKIIKFRDNSSYRMGVSLQMFLRNILLSGCNQKQMNQVLRQYLSLETKIEESRRRSKFPRSPQSSKWHHHQAITYS